LTPWLSISLPSRLRMERALAVSALPLVALLCAADACSSGSDPAATSSGATTASGCSTSEGLAGASYDVSKSRFAFGSMPAPLDAGALTRFVGSDGALAIFSDGSEEGIMNANAPESALPGWSGSTTLTEHAMAYWEAMGVAACQIEAAGTDGSAGVGSSVDGGGFTVTAGPVSVTLGRGYKGIAVVESLAVAQFDANDQTTFESFYWPAIPSAVVNAAVSLQTQLADPGALAAYKARLPANAQGPGEVHIHHTSAGSPSAFRTAATYDVFTTGDFPADLGFDANGAPVSNDW
jgi:hypothetical protein